MADTEDRPSGAQPAAAGKGKPSWAPTRGYFEVKGGGGGGAAKPAAKKAAPKKAAEAPAAAAAGESAAPAAAAPAPAATTAAKPAAAAKRPETAKPSAPPPPKVDPERDSITTLEKIVQSAIGNTVADRLYDTPDSETTLYRVPALNVLFAVTSAALLFVTLVVVWKDYNRSWKQIQADWNTQLALHYEKDFRDAATASQARLIGLEPRLTEILAAVGGADAAKSAVDRAAAYGPPGHPQRAAKLSAEALDALAAKYPDYGRLRKETEDLKTRHLLREKAFRAARGDFQAAKFRHDEKKRHVIDTLGDTGEAAREIDELNQRFSEEWVLRLEALEADVESLKYQAAAKESELSLFELSQSKVKGSDGAEFSLPDVQNDLIAIARTITDARKKVDTVEATWRSFVRNMPLADFLAPSYKIEKVVLREIPEDLNFERVARVDRCKTCHINIDNPDPSVVFVEAADFRTPWGSVYRSHPRLDLFVGDSSPHPYLEFGCTTCHWGDGHATGFVTAAHTPRDEEQKKRWEKEYGWESLHHQDFPMLPPQLITSQCLKCHLDRHRLEGGDKLNLGYEIIRTYGCFGCHSIKINDKSIFSGYDKVGPSLAHIADKADLAWVYKWIRNPSHFRPSTRMPRFFDLTNTQGKMVFQDERGAAAKEVEIDFDARNGVEALALATYITSASERRSDLRKITVSGDAARGRELFQATGCLGCHSVRRESLAGDKATEKVEERIASALAALSKAVDALPRGTEAEKKKVADVARAAGAAKSALEKLEQWFRRLSVGHNVEALYHDVASAAEDLIRLDESLGGDAGAATEVKASGRAIYDRWIHNTFAPDLSSIGSKVRNPDWLADWIVDPRRHDPKTSMPRFRLERDVNADQRVADIVAYLLTLRDPEFENRPMFAIEAGEGPGMLDSLAFDYLRREDARPVAQEKLEKMSQTEKLQFVGNRLIRRYGCFGCHIGIRDLYSPPVKTVENGVEKVVTASFDTAQPIGADLTGWGWKQPGFLDYGNWGHQHSGREAIGHSRYEWARAKLSDTRRFDVIPAEKAIDDEHSEFAPTNRLIQKTPEELLKMPLFPFASDPEAVEGVVTVLASLVKDRIFIERTETLTGDKKTLEDGARLITRLNCAGCHRVGAEPQLVDVSRLPSFSAYADSNSDDLRRAELEKETWLSRPVTLYGYDPKGLNLPEGKVLPPEPDGTPFDKDKSAARSGLALPKGFLIRESVLDPTTMAMDEEALSVVELARGPLNPESKVQGTFRARQILDPASHALPVAAFEEGRIRYYFGGSDEHGGAEQRPMAPPALVR
ncbi:MAG TPA: hypothetical protein VFD71_12330, partial [Planctomycetota bacterium]|nr:hypothetical protein [Planctomycetota bacterium]